MRISDLMQRLEKCRQEHGDIEVVVRDTDFNADRVEVIRVLTQLEDVGPLGVPKVVSLEQADSYFKTEY